MSTRQKSLSILLIISLLFSNGCGTTGKFMYPSKKSNLIQLYTEPKYDYKVAVLPFEENRGDKNNYSGVFLYLIPLVPFGRYYYERPDGADFFLTTTEYEFNMGEDLAKAAVTSLRRSGLFKDVFFTYGGDKENADLILSGDVYSTTYEAKLFSYGLSVYGPLLWFLGLPAGSSTNHLSLQLFLNLKNKKTPLWEYTFTKSEALVQGFYYNWGSDCKAFTTLMEDAMNEAIRDLNKELPTIQEKP